MGIGWAMQKENNYTELASGTKSNISRGSEINSE